VRINLPGIFLTPPRALSERLILFVMLFISFMIFFRPLQFSQLSPVEAIGLAILPTLSISWGWLVLLRFLFKRNTYLIE